MLEYLPTSQVRAAFGFKSKIPAGVACAWTQLQGGLWYRIVLGGALNSLGKFRRLHRVQVQCPICKAAIPSGRIHQHFPRHKSEERLVEIWRV